MKLLEGPKAVIRQATAILSAINPAGNARGANAVDLQSVRSGAAKVAAGQESVIGGGNDNRADGAQATIPGGNGNTANGQYAAALGGNGNTANGTAATTIGGSSNTAAADFSLAGGRRAKANDQGAMILADSQNADFASVTTDEVAIRAQGGLRYSGLTAQDKNAGYIKDQAIVATTDATVTDLFSLPLAEDRAVTIEAVVAGLRSTGAAAVGGVLWAVFRRDGGGNVTLVGAVQGTVQSDTGGAHTFNLVADTTAQAVDVQVTGAAGQNWRWVVTVRYQVLAP